MEKKIVSLQLKWRFFAEEKLNHKKVVYDSDECACVYVDEYISIMTFAIRSNNYMSLKSKQK